MDRGQVHGCRFHWASPTLACTDCRKAVGRQTTSAYGRTAKRRWEKPDQLWTGRHQVKARFR